MPAASIEEDRQVHANNSHNTEVTSLSSHGEDLPFDNKREDPPGEFAPSLLLNIYKCVSLVETSHCLIGTPSCLQKIWLAESQAEVLKVYLLQILRTLPSSI